MKHYLILNSGSSSLKFSVFELNGEKLRSLLSGNLSGIGAGEGHFVLKSELFEKVDEDLDLSKHEDAIAKILEWLKGNFKEKVDCVGHRIVHGGRQLVKPQLIDDDMMVCLNELSRFAPLHLPPAIETVNAARKAFDDVPQVACFDTSFHRTMPVRARMLPLTKELYFDDGVEKFGFHGLSYEFVVGELSRKFGTEIGNAKLVIAHLGNGCSMAAVSNRTSVETTMGFSPAGGLVMGTRSGDIDPGLLTFFATEKKMSASNFVEFVNQKSGLKGLSGVSSDMKKLLDQEDRNEDAKRAIEIFCYHVRKHIGALSAALGGIDALVFTGGIGENASPIRERICSGLKFLGVEIDETLNEKRGTAEITKDGSSARTFVVETNEELMIAEHCKAILSN
jgi:acetate kinase